MVTSAQSLLGVSQPLRWAVWCGGDRFVFAGAPLGTQRFGLALGSSIAIVLYIAAYDAARIMGDSLFRCDWLPMFALTCAFLSHAGAGAAGPVLRLAQAAVVAAINGPGRPRATSPLASMRQSCLPQCLRARCCAWTAGWRAGAHRQAGRQPGWAGERRRRDSIKSEPSCVICARRASHTIMDYGFMFPGKSTRDSAPTRTRAGGC